MKKSNANVHVANRPLNKTEQQLYNRLKHSFKQIKLHQEGKIELKSIEELLSEISPQKPTKF